MLIVYNKSNGYIERVSMSSTHDITHAEACPDKDHSILACCNVTNSQQIFENYWRYRVSGEQVIKKQIVTAIMECNKTKIDKNKYQMASGEIATCNLRFINEENKPAFPTIDLELKINRGKLSEKFFHLSGQTSQIPDILLQSPDETITIDIRIVSKDKYAKQEIDNIRQTAMTISLI